MTKPRCETCPWWTRDAQISVRDKVPDHGVCHANEGPPSVVDASPAGWWCSLHPDAPKPVYEAITIVGSDDTPSGDGWEPVNGVPYSDWNDGAMILWRRISGYTGGGSDAEG